MANDGKYLEHLVHLIEKSINSDARVEHDVDLPVLTSTIGATRQCDIVITQGKPPRQTVTIIEVQDRGSKPSRNDFGGWMGKLKEVGAQHLICVSREGFSASIIEQAAQSGSTVRLIELKEIGEDQIPLDFFSFTYTISDFDIKKAGGIEFQAKKEEFEKISQLEERIDLGTIDLNNPIFSEDGEKIISLYQLIRNNFPVQPGKTSGVSRLDFPLSENNNVYLFLADQFIKIKFKVEFEWISEVYEVPVNMMSYVQNGHGVLAWVLEGEQQTERGIWKFRMPVEQREDGNFIIKNMEIENPTDAPAVFTISVNKNEGEP